MFSSSVNKMLPITLETEKICTKRKFGYVEGELRGTDESKLINPPITIDDYYHWIRDDTRTDSKVLEHIKKENAYTDFIMNPHKQLTQSIYSEVKSYIRESYDTYAYRLNLQEDWKYFRRFCEGKDYPVHWRKIVSPDGLLVKEEKLLDINLLAEGKSQCDVASFEVSPSHEYFSYGVDYDGSEKYSFVLMDVKTRQQIKLLSQNLHIVLIFGLTRN